MDKEQESLKKMEIKWDKTQKFTQAVDEMYNSSMFDEKQMMEWEYKNDVKKTWVACKMFFKKYYKLKKCYSNAKPGRMGFESAANVADKSKIESDELKNYLGGLSNSTRADKEKMNQMASINESVVELCQQLIEAKIQQGKQISYFILQVAKLTTLLTEKSTKPSGSERTAASRYEKCDKCKKFHKKGMCW